jgi:uncharacterized membrane protein
MVERNWRYFLFLIAAHHPKEKLDHTIHIKLGQKNLYFCSRCTGGALGMFTIFGAALFGLILPANYYLPVLGILPLFAVIDWFTQSARLRKSNTGLRLSSGFMLGLSEGLGCQLLFTGAYVGFLAAVGMAVIYALCVYLIASKTKCLQSYLEEIMQIS